MSEEIKPYGYPDIIEDNKEPLSVQVGGKHYKQGGMQPIELIEGVRMCGSCSSILRYIYRHKEKNGLQDLQKVLHYCDFVEKYGNWYFGAVYEPCGLTTSETDLLFHKFIKSNPQLDQNQIQVILGIQYKDLETIRKYTHQEIEENYSK